MSWRPSVVFHENLNLLRPHPTPRPAMHAKLSSIYSATFEYMENFPREPRREGSPMKQQKLQL